MKKKLKYFTKEIFIFSILLIILSNALSLYRSGDLNKEPLEQKEILLINDKIYEYPNKKPVIIHFWATWCPTCSLESSNIQTLSKHYEVLTVAVKSNKKEIQKYLKDNNLSFNVINDQNGFIAKEFNVQAYPTTFIYNKDKELIFSEVGYTSLFGLWIRTWWASL